jgi:hypothetical protein
MMPDMKRAEISDSEPGRREGWEKGTPEFTHLRG